MKNMKKQYMEPSMEAIKIKAQQLLAGSDITGIGGGVLDGTPEPGDGTGGSAGRAPLFDGPEWDALLGE